MFLVVQHTCRLLVIMSLKHLTVTADHTFPGGEQDCYHPVSVDDLPGVPVRRSPLPKGAV